jgi:hypothetical protein
MKAARRTGGWNWWNGDARAHPHRRDCAMFNVYLGTPAPKGETAGWSAPPGERGNINYSLIRSTLEDWFTRVAARTPFRTARVQYTSTAPRLNPPDILVYLVWSPDESLRVLDGSTGPRIDWGGSTGRRPGGKVLSEVYLSKCATPVLTAVAIFHEAMHNKLDRWEGRGPNQFLHSYPGVELGSANGVAATSGPSDADEFLMMSHLGEPVPQWTDGFDLYKNSKLQY